MHCLDTSNGDSSTPKRLEAQHRLGDYFDDGVVLLDDVVQVFVLSHQDVNAGVGIHTFNGRCIRAALVDGDLLGQALQVDGTLPKAPSSSQIALGCEKNVNPTRKVKKSEAPAGKDSALPGRGQALGSCRPGVAVACAGLNGGCQTVGVDLEISLDGFLPVCGVLDAKRCAR